MRRSTSPGMQQSSPRNTTPKAKHRRPQGARRHSLDSRHSYGSSSHISERREKELAKTYNLSKSKHKHEKLVSKTRPTRISSPRRSLNEESSSSIRSAHHLEATKKLTKGVDKRYGENKHQKNKHKDFYAESVSSRHSQSTNNETKHKKEKLIPADTRPKSANARRDLEKESTSSIYSARSFENKTGKISEKLPTEKRSRSIKKDKNPKQAWKDKTKETSGSRRISRDTERSSGNSRERGRSPTPEMRTAGQSRRHHLDITTGSNNPLASGPDPRQILGSLEYERVAYDPSRYSDVGESLASSRSYASWNDRGS